MAQRIDGYYLTYFRGASMEEPAHFTCAAVNLTAAEKHSWFVWNDAVNFQAECKTQADVQRIQAALMDVLYILFNKFSRHATAEDALSQLKPGPAKTFVTDMQIVALGLKVPAQLPQ